MIPGVGPQELMLVLILVFFLFGAKKVPELARSIVQAKKEYKKGMEIDDE